MHRQPGTPSSGAPPANTCLAWLDPQSSPLANCIIQKPQTPGESQAHLQTQRDRLQLRTEQRLKRKGWGGGQGVAVRTPTRGSGPRCHRHGPRLSTSPSGAALSPWMCWDLWEQWGQQGPQQSSGGAPSSCPDPSTLPGHCSHTSLFVTTPAGLSLRPTAHGPRRRPVWPHHLRPAPSPLSCPIAPHRLRPAPSPPSCPGPGLTLSPGISQHSPQTH